VKEYDDVASAVNSETQPFISDNATGTSSEVIRAAERFGLIGAAGELATEARITGWTEGEALMSAKICFKAWLAARGDGGPADIEASIARLNACIEAHGSSRFQRRDEEKVVDRLGFVRQIGERYEFLFLPEKFKREICPGVDPAVVAKALYDRGMLRRQAPHWTIHTSLPGLGKTRVYCVVLTEGGSVPSPHSVDSLGDTLLTV
jgi:putative DNA primase/helicase